MQEIASRQSLLLRFKWLRTAIAAMLASFLACFLLLVGKVHALDPDKRITQYIHTSWRTQDGSLSAGMFSIAQTTDGFLWFLSLPGDIYRFDGVRFVPRSVGHGPAGKVFADHAGGLWVVADELVHLKDGVAVSHFALKGIHGFQSISSDADGTLWIGLRGADAALCHLTDQGASCFGKNDGIPIPDINAILADGNGGFWLGGPAGVAHWRQGGVSEAYPVKGFITSLARTPNGSIWIGIADEGPGLGLQRLEGGVLKPFVTPTFDGTKVSVTSLMVDRNGNVWAATDAKGVFRIHEDKVEHYGRTDGLSGDSAWDLLEDREGLVWVGTTSGIDSFRDPRVVTFSSVEGLGKDLAAGILATKDGTILIANDGSLDRIKDGTVTSIRRSNGLPGGQVASMLEDRAGNLWVGVDDGLFRLKGGRFHRIPEPEHKPLGMVVGIAEDTEGNIWAECASKPRKLVRIRDFQVRETFLAEQVPPGHNLASDPRGGIWIETREGDITLFRNGSLQTGVSLRRTGSPLNRQILSQADGTLLVGTEDGLVGLRMGKVQKMTTKNGLPCDFVIAFIQDKEKRWWLYTRCGVVEFSDAELQRWWTDPNAIIQNRLFDALDGAQPNIGSFNSAASTSDGRVWFSTGVVVQMVDPSALSQEAVPAQTYIDSLIVDRKEFQATQGLKLSPHPRDVQIEYTSPTFNTPQKVKFRYRLDGYDRDWKEAGTRRQAFYTDLPPGKYSFRIVASHGDGVWNDRATQLDFSVDPAYYQTNWFRALGTLVIVMLVWAAYQLRVRRLAAQFNMRLEERVSERTRIARDLHDTLLQSFQGVLPRFQAAIYKLPESAVDARETLEAAVDQASQAITEGRDAVQGLRASTVEKNDLAMAIRRLAEELATADTHQPSPAFQVAVQGTPRNLHPILRDEVYRVAAEALRNGFRHAQARQIEVEIHYDDKEFSLHVRDDGKGIDPSVLGGDGREGHFGLHGMRERAKLGGGELAIWSEVDSGTEIELSIPATRAYSKSVRRFWFFEKMSNKDTDQKEKIES